MIKGIDNVVRFPVNAQRSSLFGALASILLYRDAYTEDTPFFCGKHQRSCIRCGGCPNEPFLHKHHLRLYQYLITITGCAYFWTDKEIGNPFNERYDADAFSETALDRLSLALHAAGYRYESWNKNAGEQAPYDRIKQSVGEGQPVLIKLGKGDVWAVITGYDEKRSLPYLMKARHAPQVNRDWYENLGKIVFITNRYESDFTLSEALNHMVRHLNTDGRNRLEQKVYRMLETERDGKKLGMWLNRLNGFAIENRWHASECYLNTFMPASDDNAYRKLLSEAADLHLRFHDQAWKVWGLLGVSPQTGYRLPADVNELAMKADVRAELKSLFRELFDLDRRVSCLLRECLALPTVTGKKF